MIDKNILDKIRQFSPRISESIGFAIKHQNVLEMANSIATIYPNSKTVIAALLYSTLETTNLTLKEVNDCFGSEIMELINNIIKFPKVNYSPYYHIVQTERFVELLLTIDEVIREEVLVIKLTHLLCNIMFNKSKSVKERQLATLELMEFYVALLENAGMEALKIELQDFCFKMLQPKLRSYILNCFQNIYNDGKVLINVINTLKHVLDEAGIAAEISGRVKTPYSIWIKMRRNKDELKQLYDVVAVRIIVKDQLECYLVLDIVHNQYQNIPDRFSDYIKTPKANGYQSLHTIIISSIKQNIEIQIRSKAMHNIALYGSAAHWKYKNRTALNKIIAIKDKIYNNIQKLSHVLPFIPYTNIMGKNRLLENSIIQYKLDLKDIVLANNARDIANVNKADRNIVTILRISNKDSTTLTTLAKSKKLVIKISETNLNSISVVNERLIIDIDNRFLVNQPIKHNQLHLVSHDYEGNILLDNKAIQVSQSLIPKLIKDSSNFKCEINRVSLLKIRKAVNLSKLVDNEFPININELNKHKATSPTETTRENETVVITKLVTASQADIIQEFEPGQIEPEQVVYCLRNIETPFLETVRSGDIEKVKAFLIKGIDINQQNQNAETALIVAASCGNVEVVKLLINHLRNLYQNDIEKLIEAINACDNEDRTALYHVVDRYFRLDDRDCLEVINILLDLVDRNSESLIDPEAVNFVEEYINEELGLAIEERDAEEVKKILTLIGNKYSYLININQLDEYYVPLFILAIWDNDLELVKLLLSCPKIENEIPFLEAVGFGNLEIVKALLTIGIDIDQQNQYGETALIVAVLHGNVKIAELLINYLEDLYQDDIEKLKEVINTCDSMGNTALYYAVDRYLQFSDYGCLKIIEILFDLKKENSGSLIDPEVVNFVEEYINEELGLAIKERDTEEVKKILTLIGNKYSYLININQLDEYYVPLFILAIWDNDLELVKLLLSCPEIENEIPFLEAVGFGNLEIVKALLTIEVDVDQQNQYGETALIVAVLHGNVKIAELLINYLEDLYQDDIEKLKEVINTCDSMGNTALYYAVDRYLQFSDYDCLEIIEILFGLKKENGWYLVDLDVIDVVEEYINEKFWLAMEYGNIEEVKKLLLLKNKYGFLMNINQLDEEIHPLAVAICLDNLELVKLLLSYFEMESKVIFLEAVRSGNPEIVEAFLATGVNINQRNQNAETALIIAASYGNIEVVKLLINHSRSLYKNDIEKLKEIVNACDNGDNTALYHATYGYLKFGDENYLGIINILFDLLIKQNSQGLVGVNIDISTMGYFSEELWLAEKENNIEKIKRLFFLKKMYEFLLDVEQLPEATIYNTSLSLLVEEVAAEKVEGDDENIIVDYYNDY